MQNQLSNQETTSVKSEEFNLKDTLFRYLFFWKWFVVSVLICLTIAFIFLRYKEIHYGVNSTILIKDEKKGGTSEFSAFSDLNIFSAKNNIENEIVILKSRGISQSVVKKLDLDISYFSQGRVVTKELYNESPIKIVFTRKNDNYYTKPLSLLVRVLNKEEFEISTADRNNVKKYRFGQKIACPIGEYLLQ
ncbi:MAG: hypothetical protein ACOVNZ_10115, partial [Crocinitomicaceae bacterium]